MILKLIFLKDQIHQPQEVYHYLTGFLSSTEENEAINYGFDYFSFGKGQAEIIASKSDYQKMEKFFRE
jgi:hypothetical protein